MGKRPQSGVLVSLALGAGIAAFAAPAAAFSLFGIHLWGEREEEDRIEVIDPLPKGEGGLVHFKCRVR